jgi:hypothetical protein
MQSKLFISFLMINMCVGLTALDLKTGGGLTIMAYTEGLDVESKNYYTAHIKNDWIDWGLYAFFDAKYVEFDISYYRALTGKYKQTDFGDPFDLETKYNSLDISYLDFCLMLKYPYRFGKNTLGFFGGFAYKLNLTSDYSHSPYQGDVRKEYWDELWLKFGAEYDRDLSEKIFIRAKLLFGFPLATKEWKDRASNIQSAFGLVIRDVTATPRGVGGEFGIALGYRIK